MHLWIVPTSVDLSRAFVGGFKTVFTPYETVNLQCFGKNSSSFYTFDFI